MLTDLKQLLDHASSADREVLRALGAHPVRVPPEALREMAHIIGAQEVWLARLEGRVPRLAVWPELTLSDIEPELERVHASLSQYLASREEASLSDVISYTNSAGRSFRDKASDILLHVFLHSQYHRGRINLLLRQAGLDPAHADFIAFVRGVPAATHPPGAD